MKLTALGAAGEVTGSAYLLETSRACLLVDAGMFQGARRLEALNRAPASRRIGRLDSILITHAHLDHTGRLPLLVQRGYRGPVFATPATIELAELVLKDAARIQASDADRANRKNERAGLPLVTPLYSAEDVELALTLFRPLDYDTPAEVAPGVVARFVEAGHLLGSASIELTITDQGKRKIIVFSGDLGPRAKPILADRVLLDYADVVVMESTYGDRDHRPPEKTNEEVIDVINRAYAEHGKILVPAFALGRTQELLFLLAAQIRQGHIDRFPVYLDSPMAIAATLIYRAYAELFDPEARSLVESGQLAKDLADVKNTTSGAESAALNETPGPMMIIAGSGMCTAGRTLHHLRHNLWRPETAVIFTGYQGTGSLGRRIVAGAPQVKIFGERIQVQAHVATINGLSGHAGQSELLEWLAPLAKCKPRLIVTHGEASGRTTLAALAVERYGLEPLLPLMNEKIEL
jgi:metallo-beta-lactamase family protein